MFKCLIKGLLAGTAIQLLDNYRRLSIQLLKIEAARCYLRGVQAARMSAIGLIGIGLVVGFICVGVLIFHAGLFILLPWSVTTKAILGLFLGLVYAALGGYALYAAMNEKTWMEKSGAAKMLKDVTGQANLD